MIHITKKTVLLAATTLLSMSLLASCSSDKDKEVEIITLSDATAKVEVSNIKVLSGTKVFYDFKTNTTQDSAKSMVNLSGMYGSTLKSSQPNVYKMAYFDKAGTTVEQIKLDDVLSTKLIDAESFTIDASSAGAPAAGPTWIIYDFKNNHAVYPTADRYIVMYKGSSFSKLSDELYVIKAKDITAAQGNADYTLQVKKFIK